jgi:anti-sigma factor RsiW
MTKCHDVYPALIEPFVDGELSRSDRNALLSHLVRCFSCRKTLAETEALSRMVRRSRPEVYLASALRQRTMARDGGSAVKTRSMESRAARTAVSRKTMIVVAMCYSGF